jgi:hypothetical protein
MLEIVKVVYHPPLLCSHLRHLLLKLPTGFHNSQHSQGAQNHLQAQVASLRFRRLSLPLCCLLIVPVTALVRIAAVTHGR